MNDQRNRSSGIPSSSGAKKEPCSKWIQGAVPVVLQRQQNQGRGRTVPTTAVQMRSSARCSRVPVCENDGVARLARGAQGGQQDARTQARGE